MIPIKEFLQAAITEINAALPAGYIIDDAIDFEISVTTTKSRKGGVDIKVITGGAVKETEVVHTISFSIVHASTRDKEAGRSIESLFNGLIRGFKRIEKTSPTPEHK